MTRYILAFLLFTTPAYALDMRGMLDWIQMNSDYVTVDIPLPTIRVVTGEDLQILYYGRLPGPTEVFLTIEAIYVDKDLIWIRDGIDPESNAYQSTILHELVHHAQEYSDKEFACIGASEGDAYALGNQYVVEVLHDESLKSDALVVMLLTQCARF